MGVKASVESDQIKYENIKYRSTPDRFENCISFKLGRLYSKTI